MNGSPLKEQKIPSSQAENQVGGGGKYQKQFRSGKKKMPSNLKSRHFEIKSNVNCTSPNRGKCIQLTPRGDFMWLSLILVLSRSRGRNSMII